MASPAGLRTATCMRANCGRYFASGSSIDSFPCSSRPSAATVVSGLVIDAMLKMASVVIDAFVALSR